MFDQRISANVNRRTTLILPFILLYLKIIKFEILIKRGKETRFAINLTTTIRSTKVSMNENSMFPSAGRPSSRASIEHFICMCGAKVSAKAAGSGA